MSPRQDADITPMVAQTLPGLDTLVRLELVAFAAHDVERHGFARRKQHAAAFGLRVYVTC